MTSESTINNGIACLGYGLIYTYLCRAVDVEPWSATEYGVLLIGVGVFWHLLRWMWRGPVK